MTKTKSLGWSDIMPLFGSWHPPKNPFQTLFGDQGKEKELLDCVVKVVRAWTYAGIERDELPSDVSSSTVFREAHRQLSYRNRYTGRRPVQVTFGPRDENQGRLIWLAIAPPTRMGEVQDRDFSTMNEYFIGAIWLPFRLAGRLMRKLAALPTCQLPAHECGECQVYTVRPVAALVTAEASGE